MAKWGSSGRLGLGYEGCGGSLRGLILGLRVLWRPVGVDASWEFVIRGFTGGRVSVSISVWISFSLVVR